MTERAKRAAADFYNTEWASIEAELKDEIARLRGFLFGDAICPCCQEVEVCIDGCTFAQDAPSDAERMAEVREVLWPKSKESV